MALDPDIYNVKRAFERVNELRDLAAMTLTPSFVRHARRALLPVPGLDRPPSVPHDLFPPLERRPIPGLSDRRVAIVTSGGAGACVSLCGAARALEEAEVEPVLISACSGSAIWAAMWCAGMDAEAMAAFSLAWRPEDYVDVRWLRLARVVAAALRGFTGVLRGEAIERTFDARFGAMPAGDLRIPLATIVYDMDRGAVEYFGTRGTPALPIGRLVRIAIALPVFVEAVDVGGHRYVDGGIIDLLPIRPVLDDGAADRVLALNVMLPPQLEPEDITGWDRERMGILRASRQLQQGYHLEIARRSREQLGDALTIVDVADHRLGRGLAFYDLFIDRTRWPELIREGYRRTRAALDALRPTPAAPVR